LRSRNHSEYGTAVRTQGIRNTESAKWYPMFLNPNSIQDFGESVLARGELGTISGLSVGPAGAWFYPVDALAASLTTGTKTATKSR
jgi:hypothetical protein